MPGSGRSRWSAGNRSLLLHAQPRRRLAPGRFSGSSPALIGDSQALKQFGGEIAPADAGGIRDGFRLQERACQGIQRADVRLRGALLFGHTDARTRKLNPAVGQNPAVLDQRIQRVVRHNHDVDGFTPFDAAGNGV